MKLFFEMEDIKVYKKLIIPADSAWDRKYKWYQLYDIFHSWVIINHQYTKIYYFLDIILFNPIYNLRNGLTNIKNWYRIIWKDRNFDHHYIHNILQHKLELTRTYQVSKNRHSDIEETNKYITICLNLIERVKSDYYGTEYLDYQETKWRFDSTDLTMLNPLNKKMEMTSRLEIDVIKENLDDYINKYKHSLRDVKKNLEINGKDYNDKHTLALHVSNYNHEKAKKLLFSVLNKKLDHWWD